VFVSDSSVSQFHSHLQVAGRYGSELTIDGRTCQTFNTETKWSFEGPVKVDKQSEAVVSHKVREKSTTARCKLLTTITATKHEIPVYIKNWLTGKPFGTVILKSNNLGRIFQDVAGFKQVGDSGKCIVHECIVESKTFDSAEHYIEVVTKPLKSESADSRTEIVKN
jgi:hypothetical protein